MFVFAVFIHDAVHYVMMTPGSLSRTTIAAQLTVNSDSVSGFDLYRNYRPTQPFIPSGSIIE